MTRYEWPSRYHMMTSSNINIFRVTGHLCGEFTGDRWIPHTKASDAKLWCSFDLRLNKQLSKQSWGWWFEALSRPLWRHRNDEVYYDVDRHVFWFAPEKILFSRNKLTHWLRQRYFVCCLIYICGYIWYNYHKSEMQGCNLMIARVSIEQFSFPFSLQYMITPFMSSVV